MDLKQEYREETNKEPYELDAINGEYTTTKYIKWLEAKINYLHSSLQLKEDTKPSFEEYVDSLGYTKSGDEYFICGTVLTHWTILHREYRKALKDSL